MLTRPKKRRKWDLKREGGRGGGSAVGGKEGGVGG